MTDSFTFDAESVRRISATVNAVEGMANTTKRRPRLRRPMVLPAGRGERLVIIRGIPNEDGIELVIENAVPHPNFAGEAEGPEGPEALGRFVAASEVARLEDPDAEQPEPVLESMFTWFHTWARDYRVFIWPVGAATTRLTHIMPARKAFGRWWVRMDFRPYIVETAGPVVVGSCHPREQLQGLV